MSASSPLRLVYIVTVPFSAVTLLGGQLRYFADSGYDVHLICAPGVGLDRFATQEHITLHTVALEREIRPLADVRATLRIWRLLREIRPDVTNVGTPKAGLLGGVAAWLARVPARIYVLWGLRLETTSGLMRAVLASTERIACGCAHRVVCVSESLRDELVTLRLSAADKTVVIGAGSVNGVDAERFSTARTLPETERLREALGLAGDRVVGFVGRLTRDKGVPELVEAFDVVAGAFDDARLLLVGTQEPGDPLPDDVRSLIARSDRIVHTGFVEETTPYYRLMSVLCLPSHREGFPNVPLEAAASGVPTITTQATGARDSVVDGVTGLIVPVGDVTALARAIIRLLGAPHEASVMGEAARARALAEFSPPRVWDGLAVLYDGVRARARRA